jgi:hypothetical protein
MKVPAKERRNCCKTATSLFGGDRLFQMSPELLE